MQEDEELNPADRELAEALRGLELAPVGTPQQVIWFKAGVAAGRRVTNAWRAMAVTMTLAAALVFGWGRQASRPAQRVIEAGREVAPAGADSLTSSSEEYLRLCDETIREGLEGRRGEARAEHYLPTSNWPRPEEDSAGRDGQILLNKGS